MVDSESFDVEKAWTKSGLIRNQCFNCDSDLDQRCQSLICSFITTFPRFLHKLTLEWLFHENNLRVQIVFTVHIQKWWLGLLVERKLICWMAKRALYGHFISDSRSRVKQERETNHRGISYMLDSTALLTCTNTSRFWLIQSCTTWMVRYEVMVRIQIFMALLREYWRHYALD